jgi:squalene-hopene/tetraprenyl-beta-curcumene cyclase
VQAAYKWMTANYTLEFNPGTTKKHGLFYFYNAFAKVMSAYGEDTFVDGNGQRHNWRNELAQRLLSLQSPDGSWANRDSNAWWEDRPQLVTAWSVIALEHVVK